MRRLILLLLAALVVLAPLAPAGAQQASSHARRATLPPRSVWLAKVKKKVAGADAAIDSAVAAAPKGAKLAMVLDIDNTSIQTHYAWPKPVKPVRKVARYAAAHGVTLFFVTGRGEHGLSGVEPVLDAAGYHYAGVYGRRPGEGLAHSKQRNRAAIAAAGYTVVLDIGNRATDLSGANTGTTIKLPSYDGLLS